MRSRGRSCWAALVQRLLIGVLVQKDVGAEPGRQAPGSDSPPALIFVTLNLLHGGFLSGLTGHDEHLEQRLGLVIRELRSLAPDLVGLQGASTSHERGNVAARLADELGWRSPGARR